VEAAYVGPGDIMPGAAGWWGLRGYTAAYAASNGPSIDITDSVGGNAATINILPSGFLDMVALNSYIASHGTPNISMVYDQTGGGKNMTVPSATIPTVLVSPPGGLGAGLASIRFTTINTLTSIAGIGSISQPLTLSLVASLDPSATNRDIFTDGSASDSGIIDDNIPDSIILYFGGSVTARASCTNSIFHTIQGMANDATSILCVDGVNTNIDVASSSGWSTHASIQDLTRNGTGGYYNEWGIWSGDQSAHFSLLNANQRSATYGWNF
jgi:hypothetical protein